ncbi:MAG: hypothetical protein R6V26_01560 [Roseovarius sp.]
MSFPKKGKFFPKENGYDGGQANGPLCQGCCRLVSKVNDTMRRAEERTTGGIFRGAEGICDCEDASAAQHSVAAAVAGRGHIERDAFAVAG